MHSTSKTNSKVLFCITEKKSIKVIKTRLVKTTCMTYLQKMLKAIFRSTYFLLYQLNITNCFSSKYTEIQKHQLSMRKCLEKGLYNC